MSSTTQRGFRTAVVYVVLIAFGVLFAAPFVWLMLSSFKETQEVYEDHLLPREWLWGNYPSVLEQVRFARYMFNSLLVAFAVTFLQVLTSAMAAYAFARLRWKGRDLVFFLYLATMMIPYQLTLVPNFIVVTKLGLMNSYWALILPAAFSTYGTFLLRQFMRTLPRELDEAAALDGCSRYGIWWRITLPLCKPSLATLGILVWLGNWQSFTWPLIVTSSEGLRTLPVGISYFQNSYGADIPLLMAAAAMMMVPLMIVFVIGQRYVIEGIQMGALK